MKYLALIYSDETASDEENADRGAVIEQYLAFSRDGRAAGVIIGGDELAPTRSATTVRVRSGEQLVVDGPYAEVKEALGGYYLFECDSIDDALDWAARIPGAAHGAVEVRPVHTDEEHGSEATLAGQREEVAS